MRTELHLKSHHLTDSNVIEVWYKGVFLATITGCVDWPGVRIISKHKIHGMHTEPDADGVMTIEVDIKAGEKV